MQHFLVRTFMEGDPIPTRSYIMEDFLDSEKYLWTSILEIIRGLKEIEINKGNENHIHRESLMFTSWPVAYQYH